MRICGIIAEYDPFHNGHAWHLNMAKSITGADRVVCVISGCFTQRGMPALIHPIDRAEMALHSGADLVLQLPYSFSVCTADRFASGGVHILNQAGASSLCFGAEPEGIPYISEAAQYLEQPEEDYYFLLRRYLDDGLPFPKAQGMSLSACLHIPFHITELPNTILGISYVRACLRLKADFSIFPVPRSGNYHNEVLSSASLPSAAAVRSALYRHDWDSVREAVPEYSYSLLRRLFEENDYHLPDALTGLLRWKLRCNDSPCHLPDLSEGLQNRLHMADSFSQRDDIVKCICSRRYSYARVSRLLSHVLTDADSRYLDPLPSYAYLLGFRKDASELVNAMHKNGFSVLAHIQDNPPPYEQMLDERADSLWALGAGKPFGGLYRRKPYILE